MTNPLIEKLEARDDLSEEERQVLAGAVARTRKIDANEDIIHEGARPTESTLLLEGWAARYKLLRQGKRQILAFHVVGDFVDLHSFLLKPMDHAVVALTPCTLAMVPHEVLHQITRRYPHLTRLLWLNGLIDGAIHRQWIAAMGRLSAVNSLAHLICELFLRLQVVGHTEGHTFRVPVTQAGLSDALGLSTVHVNRVLQELRQQGLITWQGDLVTIHDWDRLAASAEFDPTYLNLNREPR